VYTGHVPESVILQAAVAGGPWPVVLLKSALTAWLVVLSVIDRRQRRVPNVLVLPVMVGALIWQVYFSLTNRSSAVLLAVAAWLVLFGLWRAHIFGGGDAKLLMALTAMFPTTQFLLLLSFVKLIVSVPLLIHKVVRRGGLSALRGVRERLARREVLPREEELETQGRPHCWSYALSGVIYLWCAW